MATTSSMLHLIAKLSLLKKIKNRIYMDKNLTCTAFVPKKDIYIYIYVGSQIVAHTLIETGNGPNKPNTINL